MNVITNKLNTSLPSLLKKDRVWGFFLFLLFSLPISAKTWTADQVKELITRVNTYWQQNNKAETRSFWDPAAYHTGNMEVYKLLKDDKQLDPSRWKYANYGEGKDYVLFGDWQVCFQTYIDLYNLAIANGGTDADNYFMVKRAKEVMHYEAYSKKDDYWWWSDALYMVMPVMTKMYKLTGDVQYLDKLYENLLYSDRIMLDQETGLYFRDARYVYPNHKSVNGKKDFWARGDGWVLAGLAKVLQDLPKDYKHYKFFVDKFQRLADIVAKTQQKDGYWTRSILDPNHAPGPETSGTAFFAYGIMWGVNNGFLAKKDYKKCIDRAWQYISETAVQADGKVGYVQPIGDRAIPGQTVDANSQANFGVGAVLLAACEYYRYIDNQK